MKSSAALLSEVPTAPIAWRTPSSAAYQRLQAFGETGMTAIDHVTHGDRCLALGGQRGQDERDARAKIVSLRVRPGDRPPAMDAGSVGSIGTSAPRSPLSADLLREAAPGYCDARQRGNAPADWFEASLAYLTQELHGATAALAPVALPGTMGRPEGYELADYPQQHLGRRRRTAIVPAATWRSLLTRLGDPDDRVRAASAAFNRLPYD